MNANREILEDQLKKYEMQLKSLRSYLTELNNKAAELGTDRSQFQDDLIEAEHNVKYYEGETARIRKELGGLNKGAPIGQGADTVLPRTVKQGIGSLIFSSISFAAGILLGSRLNARRGSNDRPGTNERV